MLWGSLSKVKKFDGLITVELKLQGPEFTVEGSRSGASDRALKLAVLEQTFRILRHTKSGLCACRVWPLLRCTVQGVGRAEN